MKNTKIYDSEVEKLLKKYDKHFDAYNNIKKAFPLSLNDEIKYWYSFYNVLSGIRKALGKDDILYKDMLKIFKQFLSEFINKDDISKRIILLNHIEDMYGAKYKQALLNQISLFEI